MAERSSGRAFVVLRASSKRLLIVSIAGCQDGKSAAEILIRSACSDQSRRLQFAEFSLGGLGGQPLVVRVDLDRALADLALAAVVAEHVFHEADDKS